MEDKFIVQGKYTVKVSKDITTSPSLAAMLGEQAKQIISALMPHHQYDFKRWLDKNSLLLALDRKSAQAQESFQGIYFPTFQPTLEAPEWVMLTAPAGDQKGKETRWATACCTMEEYRQGRGKE